MPTMMTESCRRVGNRWTWQDYGGLGFDCSTTRKHTVYADSRSFRWTWWSKSGLSGAAPISPRLTGQRE